MPATAELRQSISTTGYLDGLGRRSIRFDREFGTTLECLHVRPELRAYEDALLAQACVLSELRDAQVVRIRSLEREQGRLVVISELPRGDRLCDVFDSRPPGARSSIDATFGFLLQILPTLAALHRASIVHGAIAPGRVMIEGAGRVILADALFGTALPRLNLSRQRLWHEFEIAFAAEEGGSATGADIAQAALCSVAVALGRQLDTEDPRQALPSVIDHLAELARMRGGDRLSQDVRALFRSLLPVYGVPSQATATQATDRVREIAARDLDENACRAAFAEFVSYDPDATVIASFEAHEPPNEIVAAPIDFIAESAAAPVEEHSDASPLLDFNPERPMFGVTAASARTEQTDIPSPVERVNALIRRSPLVWKIAAGAVLVIGLGVIVGRTFMQGNSGTVSASAPADAGPPAAPAATTVQAAPAVARANASTGVLTVATEPTGARVLVDGVQVGYAPLRLDSVAPGRRTITTIAGAVSAKQTVTVEAGKTAVVQAVIPTGWITVNSPVKLDVSEGNLRLGSTDQPRIQVAPGRHTITLSNRAVNYSSIHTVNVKAGEDAAVNVAPTGRVNLNAQPWAEVWIDGTRAGETPLANLQVPLGSREFVFKHPQYGERKLTATVSTTPSALTVDFTKPPSQRP